MIWMWFYLLLLMRWWEREKNDVWVTTKYLYTYISMYVLYIESQEELIIWFDRIHLVDDGSLFPSSSICCLHHLSIHGTQYQHLICQTIRHHAALNYKGIFSSIPLLFSNTWPTHAGLPLNLIYLPLCISFFNVNE